jgi:hypothetical protein
MVPSPDQAIEQHLRKQQIVSTMVAALIATNGATTTEEVQKIYADMWWTMYPEPNNETYRAWKKDKSVYHHAAFPGSDT